eukprot:scaffold842_cov22-Prasinocladus_malaysianus.AAC.1
MAQRGTCTTGMSESLLSDGITLPEGADKNLSEFIREIGYFVVHSMVHSLPEEQLASVATELAKQLVDGLSDNWSQVREPRRDLTALSFRA